MPSAPGATPNPRPGRSNVHMPAQGQGGSPRTLILGTAAVAAGLGAFWLLQFKVQNRSHNSSDPTEMPTWQYRHASQVPEFNARMSSSGGSETAVRNGNEATPYTSAADSKRAPGAGGADSSGMVQAQARGADGRGSESGAVSERGGESDTRGKDGHLMQKDGFKDKAVLSSIMTFLHGDPKKATQDAVGQPAPASRMNDRGGIYTKNTEYKDGYRRD